MQGASEPVCTGQVLKSLQGASPKDFHMQDGEGRRKSTVLTRNMVVPAIRAQNGDPGPEPTMLSQWDAEQEPVGPARSSTELMWCSGISVWVPTLFSFANYRWVQRDGLGGDKEVPGAEVTY